MFALTLTYDLDFQPPTSCLRDLYIYIYNMQQLSNVDGQLVQQMG